MTQVILPLLLMLILDKKLSFIQHLYLLRKNEVIKTENKIFIVTLIIKGHENCKINLIFKILQKNKKILVIEIFVKKNLTLRFVHKNIIT